MTNKVKYKLSLLFLGISLIFYSRGIIEDKSNFFYFNNLGSGGFEANICLLAGIAFIVLAIFYSSDKEK